MIRDEGFEAALHFLIPNWSDAEAFLAGAEELLAYNATAGVPFDDGTWILPMAPVRGADVWLYYTFHDTVVVLFEVKAFIY